MLFANAVFNILTGVFDCTNCVFCVLNYVAKHCYCFCPSIRLFIAPYCVMQTAILLFVFRIMFFQIRVFREIGRNSLVRVISYAHISRGKKIHSIYMYAIANMAERSSSSLVRLVRER